MKQESEHIELYIQLPSSLTHHAYNTFIRKNWIVYTSFKKQQL